MFGFFSLQFSAGLSIYFVISNLIRIVQYYAIRPREQGEGAKGKKQKQAVQKKAKR
jgi:membrane protein insertase Oxa1/YidC/SpoIIIJ